MTGRVGIALAGMILLVTNVVATAEDVPVGVGVIQWHSLPKLPDAHGLAGRCRWGQFPRGTTVGRR